ncbi:unnamed protein product [Symbiodinium sp. CCMP2592]|nr:unnamed protein product [Symbiodinium sp. CCMP2592]
MRVAGSTRAALRQVLLSRDLADQTDAVLDRAVRLARQEVGRRRPTNLEEERSAFSAALSGLGGLTQPYEIDWEVEDFSSLMWELWSSATQGTQSATRLPCLSEDEEAWQESCAELLEALRASQTWPLAKWHLRAVGICWLLAVLCIAAIQYGTWTGRQRLGLVCGIGMFPLFGELLRRYTFDTTDLQFTQPSRRTEDVAGDPSAGVIMPEHGTSNVGADGTAPTELMQSLSALAQVPVPSARLPAASTVRWRPALGQAVIVTDTPPYQDFKDELGAVVSVHDSGLVDIALCSGAMLYQVLGTSLKVAQLRGDEPECEQLARLSSKALESAPGKGASLSEIDHKHATYAPLSMAAIEATQSQARVVKNLLVKWSARAALIPSWSRSFWKEVGEQGKFEYRVEALLKSFGYLGNGSGTPPRVAELKEKLAELESSGALAHSTALFDNGLLDAHDTEIDEEDAGGWEASLPPDMKRAGPEIYASFRASGARSAREWLNQMIPLDRRGDALYLDLFNQASLVDFAVKDAKGSQAQALSLIARSDTAEVALRRLASYVHEKRTGDRDAAVSMLAIKPTNLSHDIAPAWLVSEAALFAQSEHKRRERAKAQRGDAKGTSGQAKGSSKGDGRGRGDKRPKGGEAPRVTPPATCSTQTAFSSADGEVFPLPLLPPPVIPASTSARSRNRYTKKLRLWKYAVGLIHFLNFMHVGTNRHTKKLYGAALVDEPNQAQKALAKMVSGPAGRSLRQAQPAVAALVKSAKVDAMGYATVSKTHAQVPMDASRIVEPSDEQVVDMLQALPQDERQFYAREENVVELLGKSTVIQQELEQQYAFVGGSLDEYLKYFHRQDIPTNMWEWKCFRDVKAVAGFSVVPKKDGRSQRKRQAFTRVAVPAWMIPYLAAPPITAGSVWGLLPDSLKATISEFDLVSPCYNRLPMGCSHSVHILMMINLQVIGRSLRANASMGTGQDDIPHVEEPSTAVETSGCEYSFYGCSDDEWWSRFQVGVRPRFDSGYSVQEWWDAIRAARSSSDRTIVVMNFFGGERTDGDVQEYVEKLAAEANLKVLMITVDLGCDSRWDVAQPETFHDIMRMLEGYIDRRGSAMLDGVSSQTSPRR